MAQENENNEKKDIEENDNIGQEEDTEDEEQKQIELNIDNVNEHIDWLEEYTIDSISSKGFYFVSNESVKIHGTNGEEIEVDEDDEEYKEHQVVRRIGAKELFDFTKKPPIIRGEFCDTNFVYYDGNGNIYYGNLNIKECKTDKGEEYVIVPDGRGRIYNNKKCLYAGFFNNGKKTQGLVQKGEEKYFFDHKGSEPFISHASGDLLISFEHDDSDLAKKRRSSDMERYSNSIFFDSKDAKKIDDKGYKKDAKVKNIKIQIDNGYRPDFLNKNDDFLDDDGNRIRYNPKDINKMYIDVDNIVDKIVKIAEQNKDTLKVIEIVGISSYGLLEDKNGKKLIDEIAKKLNKLTRKNDIKIFFSNTKDPVIVQDEQYKSGKELTTIVDRNREYYYFNNDSSSFDPYENKKEYNDALKKNGYYENNVISLDKEKVGNIVLLQSTNKVFEDRIDKIVEATEKDSKEVIDELEAKNKSIEECEVSTIDPNVSTKKDGLSIFEMFVTFIGGIIIPIAGWNLLYNFFRSKHGETDLIKNIENEKKRIADEKKKDAQKKDEQQKKDDNGDEKKKDAQKKDEQQKKDDNGDEKKKDDSYSQQRMDIKQKTDISLQKPNQIVDTI